jgi:hypothetical protein
MNVLACYLTATCFGASEAPSSEVYYEPAKLLPNVMKVEWDEGCIL